VYELATVSKQGLGRPFNSTDAPLISKFPSAEQITINEIHDIVFGRAIIET
jgi:hypothetical protein